MENDMAMDKKTKSITWFTLGMLASLCCMGLAYSVSGANDLSHSRQQMLYECQKELPRSQTCVLIAVPNTPNKGENK